MKYIYKIKLSGFLLIVLTILSCTETEPVNSDKTTLPKIESLTADKSEIEFGGTDPAVITCKASGGELEYTWEVDLGDIFPLKEDNSVVRFSGSPCCIGKKFITCSVTNDKGSDSKVIEIFIKEP